MGYSYTVKRKTNVAVHWRCVVRNKKINCKATIKEKDTEYEWGHNLHCHPPETCPLVTAKVFALVKKKAMDDVFRSASDIVDKVLCDIVDPNQPLSSLPAPHNLAKQGNRKRRGARPAEPLDLDFELNEDHLPQDFLQYDVSVSSCRHLIFSTQNQLSLLSRAKHWYADATFKVVRHPFTQLFSVHTFVQCDNNLKQVPLLFVLISEKRKNDYKKVFAKIIELLGDLKVEALTIDFEKSVWRAVAEILPHVVVQGCSFHWGQAVWRKIQELGLQVAYSNDASMHKYLRKVLSLPYIPAEHIEEQFLRLCRKANGSQVIDRLLNYVRNTWINSTIWPPSAWCVFGRSIRTNNDVEGWHHRLNKKARKGQLIFYLLVQLLHKEAKLVPLQV